MQICTIKYSKLTAVTKNNPTNYVAEILQQQHLINTSNVRDELSKVYNVNFDDMWNAQLALPAKMGGLEVSSASLLSFSAFLASALSASDFLTTLFSETLEVVSFRKALAKWSSLMKEQESPLDGTQKNWTQPVYVKTAQGLFKEWMTNAQMFLTRIKANLGLNG